MTPSSFKLTKSKGCYHCTLCCRLPDIEELSKPANVTCSQCIEGFGCKAYKTRPQTCRDFQCDWLTDDTLPSEWNPVDCHMMLYKQGPQRTILVDPRFAGIWRREPFASMISDLARRSEAEGGYLILFSGDEVHRMRPTILNTV